MPIFKFFGFSAGDAVDLSVTQGARSDSATVASWGQTANSPITAEVSAIRTSGTAPMGNIFFVEANSPAARVVEPFHDIESVWSFDEPGNFTALSNSPLWGTDRNLAYGPRATHVHSVPGNRVVTCTCHDGENPTRTKMVTIEVNNPNDVFAGNDTAVVSQAGDFAGAPAGAAQFTSVAAARTHLSGRQNARLLLRAGESFGGIDISEAGGSGRRYYVGRFGSGNRPRINLGANDNGVDFNTGGQTATNFEELIVDGLEIVGTYDARTATAASANDARGVNFFNAGYDVHKTVWDCRISGIAKGIDLGGTVNFTTPKRNFYMGDTVITNWQDYGVFTGDGGDWGLSGCTIQQPTGTINGNGRPGGYPDHNPLRISRAYGVVVLSNQDWSSFNDWSSSATNRSFQPILRWNTGNGEDGSGNPVQPELVIDRFRGEGGSFNLYQGINADGGPSGKPTSTKNPAWIVADRVHHILTDHPGSACIMSLGGTTIRNCLFVVPNSRAGWSIGFGNPSQDNAFLNTGGTGPNGPGNLNRRSEAYSCAFVDLRSDAFAGNRSLSNTNRPYQLGNLDIFTDSFVGNNTLYAPNMVDGGPATPATSLDETGRYTPLYDGERYESTNVDTSRAYPDTKVTASFRPLAGSNLIGAATGKVSLLDMDGNARSGVLASLSRNNASLGPYEPSLEG